MLFQRLFQTMRTESAGRMAERVAKLSAAAVMCAAFLVYADPPARTHAYFRAEDQAAVTFGITIENKHPKDAEVLPADSNAQGNAGTPAQPSESAPEADSAAPPAEAPAQSGAPDGDKAVSAAQSRAPDSSDPAAPAGTEP